jgi:diamine N-acetyltransferase
VTIIREATAADAAQLAALAAVTFPLACPPGTLPEDIRGFLATQLSAARFAEYIADPSRVVLTAEDDGELVAYSMLVAEEPADPQVAAALTATPSVELSKCYVHPDHHGQGLSHALMQASIDWAGRERNGRTAVVLWLGVNQQNARAIAFYGKSGFRRVGTKHFTVGAVTHDDFILARPLPASADLEAASAVR